jgi:hypothetical protein
MQKFLQNLPLLHLVFSLIIIILGILRFRRDKTLFWVGMAYLPLGFTYFVQSVNLAETGIFPLLNFILAFAGYVFLLWALFYYRQKTTNSK